MADLSELDRSGSTKIAGSDSSGLEDNFMNVDSNGNAFVVDYSDGPVTPGTVAAKSGLIGGQFNTSLPTLTTGQQAAIQLDSSARLLIGSIAGALPAGSNVIGGVTQSGTWTVQQGTPPWTIQGDSASGASKAGNPVQVGGVFNTTQPTVTTGQTVEAQSTARGALIVATGIDSFSVSASQSGTWTTGRTWTLASGTDSISVVQSTSPWVTKDQSDGPVTPGTVASFSSLIGGQYNSTLPTLTNGQQAAVQLDSSGRLLIDVASTGTVDKSSFAYGTGQFTPIGGVYQDTSPTLTAGQSGVARLNVNRALHATLRDPATDVGITSDNNGTANNQRIHTATPDTTTASTALGALNAAVSIAMAGLASAGLQLAAGTLVGTIVVECSLDGGSTYPGTGSFYDPSNSTTFTSLTFSSSNTAKTLSILPIGGSSHIRVRVSAYTSGTANALMRASQVTGAAGAITAAAYGTISNAFVSTGANTATLVLAANPNRKYAYFSNGSGTQVNIQFGSSTGLSTTTGIPITAKTFYELKGDNLFTGNVYAFAASNVSLSVSEGTP